MAGPQRTSTHAVEYEKELEQRPFASHLFQVLRRLENLDPSRPRIGKAKTPRHEPWRFRQQPSMAFAPSTIYSYVPRTGDRPAELSILSFGLFGPHGPMPLHLTEYVLGRMRSEDTTFQRFADLFHHRLISLFYRAWADAQPAVQYDRPDEDRFALYVGALAGLALPDAGDQAALPPRARLHYIGHLACQSRHPEGLRSMISDYFGVPVAIEEFVGHWVELPEECRCRLGESPETGTLGKTMAVGSRIWQCQDRFRVVLGPMGETDYDRLVPGGESVGRLVELVRSYVGDELTWDVRLILRREDLGGVRLGGRARLGLNSWLLGCAATRDAGDLVTQPWQETA